MPLTTKLNNNDEDNGLEITDELDAAYVERMKNHGMDYDLLKQFADISKELDKTKEEHK